MKKLYPLAIQFIGTAKSLVWITCSVVSGRIDLPLAWLVAAFGTSFSPRFGLCLKHIRPVLARTSSVQTATCENRPRSLLFDTLAAFWKHSEPNGFLNYLIENAWKSVSTLLWLGFTVVISFKSPSQNSKQTFIDFLARRLLEFLASEAQDLEQLSWNIIFNIL